MGFIGKKFLRLIYREDQVVHAVMDHETGMEDNIRPLTGLNDCLYRLLVIRFGGVMMSES